MKKILTTAFFALIVAAFSCYAQRVKWNVEVDGGAATMTAMPANDYAQFHWAVGGGATIKLSRIIHISPSLLLTQRGAKFDGYFGSEQINRSKFSVRTNYLELPLYLALHLGNRENLSFIIKTGPCFAYGLNGKISVKDVYGDFKYTFPENLFEEESALDNSAHSDNDRSVGMPKLHRFDLLWGSEFDLVVHKHWIFGVNAKIGLLDATTRPVDDYWLAQLSWAMISGTSNSRNLSFAFTAEYQF
jgi:hypothetical protein